MSRVDSRTGSPMGLPVDGRLLPQREAGYLLAELVMKPLMEELFTSAYTPG